MFREFPSSGTQALWYKPHLNAPNSGALFLDEVDALELWGPIGSRDAVFYSLFQDATTTSVFVDVGGVRQIYLTRAQISAAVTTLFGATPQDVDVDALMVKDADGGATWTSGDAVIFSLRASGSLVDGGEIVYWTCCVAPATFLSHGGHLWDTAFNVSAAFGLGMGNEDVDALEAAPPGHVLAPSAPGVPVMGFVGAALLGSALLVAIWLALRRRAGPGTRRSSQNAPPADHSPNG